VTVLLDTSALISWVRRRPPPGLEHMRSVVDAELRSGRGIVSTVTVTELMAGARGTEGAALLMSVLDRVPAIAVEREVAEIAGGMGRVAREKGGTLPVADLLIAGTARWLDVPLLTADSDFLRGLEYAQESDPSGPWHGFGLHAASVVTR